MIEKRCGPIADESPFPQKHVDVTIEKADSLLPSSLFNAPHQLLCQSYRVIMAEAVFAVFVIGFLQTTFANHQH
jgi:hypothetical protein